MMTNERKKISPLDSLKQAQKSVEMNIGANFEVISPNEKTTRQDNKKFIAWEKWKDPFGDNWKQEEWPGAYSPEGMDSEFTSENIATEETSFRLGKGIGFISTSLGLVPITEETSPSRVFNFWLGYTNFPITRKIVSILDNVEGIEILHIFTRYRFRIGIGKLFKDREVMNAVNHRIANYLEHLEKKECPINISSEIIRRKVS